MNGNTAQQTFSHSSRAGRVRGWTRTLLVDLVAQVVAVVVLQIRLGEEQVRAGRIGVRARVVVPRQQPERRERGEQRLQLHRRHGLTVQPRVQRVRGEPARARGDVLEELNVQGGEERLRAHKPCEDSALRPPPAPPVGAGEQGEPKSI